MSSQQKMDEILKDLTSNLPSNLPKGLVLVNVSTNGGMNVSSGQIMRHMDKNQIINLQDPIEANLAVTKSKSFEKIFTKTSNNMITKYKNIMK